MPSTYTTRNRAEKQATGEGLNVWGQNLNQKTTDLFDESLDGISTINLASAATFDLSSATYTKNGESDTSRRRILIFSASNAAGTAVTVPGVQKWYIVRNSGSYPVTLAPSGGTPATVRAGTDAIIFSDGTDCDLIVQRLNEMAAPDDDVDLNSQKLINVADGTNDTDGVNKLQVTSLTSANVQLAEDWATKDTDYVSGTDNSAKSWAIGGTGSGDPAAGSAKEWATSTSTVDGGLKGARGYANDASTSASAASTSEGNAATSATNAYNSEVGASTWATSTTVVSGGFLGARGYAEAAAATLADFEDKYVNNAGVGTFPTTGNFSGRVAWSGSALGVYDGANYVAVTGTPPASESVQGIAELATQAETNTGTDDLRIVTPLKLETKLAPYVTRISDLEAGFVAGSPVSASGANVTFTNLDCDDITFKLDGVSHNNGSNTGLRMYYSTDNGSSWSSTFAQPSASISAGSTLSASIAVLGMKEGNGVIIGGQGSTSSTFPGLFIQSTNPVYALSAGAQINAIKFEWAAGSFDAGTITASKRG